MGGWVGLGVGWVATVMWSDRGWWGEGSRLASDWGTITKCCHGLTNDLAMEGLDETFEAFQEDLVPYLESHRPEASARCLAGPSRMPSQLGSSPSSSPGNFRPKENPQWRQHLWREATPRCARLRGRDQFGRPNCGSGGVSGLPEDQSASRVGPSVYWMRSVSFAGLHRILTLVAESP